MSWEPQPHQPVNPIQNKLLRQKKWFQTSNVLEIPQSSPEVHQLGPGPFSMSILPKLLYQSLSSTKLHKANQGLIRVGQSWAEVGLGLTLTWARCHHACLGKAHGLAPFCKVVTRSNLKYRRVGLEFGERRGPQFGVRSLGIFLLVSSIMVAASTADEAGFQKSPGLGAIYCREKH